MIYEYYEATMRSNHTLYIYIIYCIENHGLTATILQRVNFNFNLLFTRNI
jgi:hypothetical protein